MLFCTLFVLFGRAIINILLSGRASITASRIPVFGIGILSAHGCVRSMVFFWHVRSLFKGHGTLMWANRHFMCREAQDKVQRMSDMQ